MVLNVKEKIFIMRAYLSLRQLEEKEICVDEYMIDENKGVFKLRLDCKH